MNVRIYQAAFAPKAGEDKPTVVNYIATNIVDALNYVKSEGDLIGLHDAGPAILCGSFVDFE